MLSGGSDPAAGNRRPTGRRGRVRGGGGRAARPPVPRPAPPPLIGCRLSCVSPRSAFRQWGWAAAAAKARVYNKRRGGCGGRDVTGGVATAERSSVGTGGRTAVAAVRPAPCPQLPATKLGSGEPAQRRCRAQRGLRVSAARAAGAQVWVTRFVPPPSSPPSVRPPRPPPGMRARR